MEYIICNDVMIYFYECKLVDSSIRMSFSRQIPSLKSLTLRVVGHPKCDAELVFECGGDPNSCRASRLLSKLKEMEGGVFQVCFHEKVCSFILRIHLHLHLRTCTSSLEKMEMT